MNFFEVVKKYSCKKAKLQLTREEALIGYGKTKNKMGFFFSVEHINSAGETVHDFKRYYPFLNKRGWVPIYE